MSKISMRDSFFTRLYDLAKNDKDIMVVSADMGAPALDRFRKDMGSQFINIGIAEQNLIAVASGLAKEGKKVFTYAIAPFITSRCYEFTKLNAGLMKIPIKLVGVGAGFGYDDSGPTHHTTEDISIMRSIPHLEIYGPSDSEMVLGLVDIMYNSKNPSYIRLDREQMPDIADEFYKDRNFNEGFKELKKGKDICIVATGNMVHSALNVSKDLGNGDIGVIDMYRVKPVSDNLKDNFTGYKQIVSLEEHLLNGGLGSIISETITDNNINTKLKRIGLKDFIYAYGGRNNIQTLCNIDEESIAKEIRKLRM